MSKITYADKLLPNQEYFTHLYRGAQPYVKALHDLASAYSREFDAGRFDLVTPETVDFEEMSTPPAQLALFNAVIKLTGAKNVLEIGTFVGHSAMQFACMLGEDGHVTTIEVGAEFAAIARENFRRNGLAERVTLIQGDAATVLDGLPDGSFDLIFVDGAKQDYLAHTLKAEGLLSPRGMIIVDDVFFHGDSLNAEPTTDKGAGCRRLLDHYLEAPRFTTLLLPLGNGILILFRPGSREAA